jgi:DNA-binding MarR family transcriptional regulator
MKPLSPCHCTALRKASRRLSQIYDAALAPTGIKSTQLSILAEINRRRSEPPLSLNELAILLAMDRSTLGHNLRPLERRKLIALIAGRKDGREKHVELTKTGQEKLAEARALWDRAQGSFEQQFGRKRAADLRETLNDLIDLIGAPPEGASMNRKRGNQSED